MINKIETYNNSKKEIYIRFIMEQAILYFNTNEYDKAIRALNSISFKELNASNKKDYMLIKAHAAFLNGEYKAAKNYYKKCKNHYILNNYNYDLSLIYSDLFHMTSDNTYLELLKNLNRTSYRKNIVLKFCLP